MAYRCAGCGASLPSNSSVCRYCHTRNITDLKGVHRYTVEKPHEDRFCPQCEKLLTVLDLDVGERFLVERCERCFGMFFDPSELEVLIDRSISNVYEVNYQRMTNLIEKEGMPQPGKAYVQCPVCQNLMNRKSYGSRSGVIIDSCRDHGVWLDGGELRQLFEWAKAGGQIHQKTVSEERERIAAATEGWKGESFAMLEAQFRPSGPSSTDMLGGILGFVASLLR